MKRYHIAANILLLLFASTICFSVAEIVARYYLWNMTSEEDFRWYASINQLNKRYGYNLYSESLMIHHRLLGYYPRPNYREGKNRHNALGYRGNEIEVLKPDNVFRIVALGGSTTYGWGVENDWTLSYPNLLEILLHEKGYTNVEVINAGVPGYTSHETLINFELRVLDLDPDMIIVYEGWNDVHPRIVWPAEAYKGDLSGYRRPNINSIEMPPIWQYSTLLRLIAIRAGWMQSFVQWNPQQNGVPETALVFEFERQWDQRYYPYGIFTEVSAMEMLETNPPIYFERNIRSIVAISEGFDIETVLLTVRLSEEFTGIARAASPEYQFAIGQHNQILLQIGEETNAYVYDFASAMPSAQIYYTDGGHFTFEGNLYRANLIANYLIENGLIPR